MKKSVGILATFSLLCVLAVLNGIAGASFPTTHFTGGTLAAEFSAPSFSNKSTEHTGSLSGITSGSSSENGLNPINGTDYSEIWMTGIGSGACTPLMTGIAANQTSAKMTINSSGIRGNPVVLVESPGYDTINIQTFITNGDQEGVKE